MEYFGRHPPEISNLKDILGKMRDEKTEEKKVKREEDRFEECKHTYFF